MSNENLNKTPNWKQKLDSLDSLPGETAYDKNATWEKLHAQLGGKVGRKKSKWYWIAAACIIFALIIPIFSSVRNNYQPGAFSVKEIHESEETTSTNVGKKDLAPLSNLIVPINEKKPRLTPRKTVFKMNDGNNEKKLRLSDTASSKSLVPEMQSKPIKIIDTVSSLATIQPEKKKLRVVHINELGDPAETLPEVVRNSDKHTFQFKIANQEIYINPTTASNSNGFTILKIKPSQN